MALFTIGARVCLSVLLCSVAVKAADGNNRKPVVAIVGGGIGGSSTAYFLRELVGEDAEIVLFESDHLGGRTKTVQFAGAEFEAGASIIHSRNRYMSEFLEALNLSKVESSYSGDVVSSLYDGRSEIFRLRSGKLQKIASLLWRYGLSMRQISSLADQLLDKFDRIYNLQVQQRRSFRNLRDLLRAVDNDEKGDASWDELRIESLFGQSATTFVEENELNRQFFDELLQGVTMANYGQALSKMNAFVAFVSLVGGSADLFAVRGGNYQVSRRLVDQSRVRLRQSQVRAIEQQETVAEDGGTYVRYELLDKDGKSLLRDVDYVVIAAPQFNESSKLQFAFKQCTADSNCEDSDSEGRRNAELQRYLHIPMHRTVATFVEGAINRTTFPFYSADLSTSHHLLVTRPEMPFNSIGRQTAVDGRRPPSDGQRHAVYKIFSRFPLSDPQYSHIFEHVNDKTACDWLAYPEYAETLEQRDDRFLNVQVLKQLYYVNSIERVASALEMSAIAGKNVALLIADAIQSGNADQSATLLASEKQKRDLHHDSAEL